MDTKKKKLTNKLATELANLLIDREDVLAEAAGGHLLDLSLAHMRPVRTTVLHRPVQDLVSLDVLNEVHPFLVASCLSRMSEAEAEQVLYCIRHVAEMPGSLAQQLARHIRNSSHMVPVACAEAMFVNIPERMWKWAALYPYFGFLQRDREYVRKWLVDRGITSPPEAFTMADLTGVPSIEDVLPDEYKELKEQWIQ